MLESRHVVLRCASALLVAGVWLWSSASMALGLGDITVHSALNQPLKADIALADANGLRQSDLSVSLATPDEFSQAGIERVFFLNDLKFTPILHGNRTLIRVTSSKPVKEPFLNFLVQFNQPNGRLLREYTILIDPPGSPGIVPATDEPDTQAQSSEFPTPEAPATNAQAKPATAPAPVPAVDPAAEQLAASILQNQQLQKTIDEQNLRLQAQDVLIADGKKQLSDLQARIAELQKPPAPPVVVTPAPTVPAAAPVEAADDSIDWPLIVALVVLLGGLVAAFYVRRRRSQGQAPAVLPMPLRNEPPVDEPQSPRPSSEHPAVEHRDDQVGGDVLEAVGIYLAYGRLGEAAGLLRDALYKEPERTDIGLQLLEVLGRQGDSPAYDAQETHLRQQGVEEQALQDVRARHPKLTSPAPVAPVAALTPAVVAPVIEERAQTPQTESFQLNPGELSMDSSWDLEDSRPLPARPETGESAFGAGLQVLPQDFELPELLADDDGETSELEWIRDTEAPPLDDDFLSEFGDPDPTPPLPTLDLQAPDPQAAANAGKLEQAQTCIDDGDIDSAIALLNELLREADGPLKQTARTLLAGIR